MRFIVFAVTTVILAWAIGLLVFIASLPPPAATGAVAADGIVVYTGGAARLSAGMTLLERGAGQRLLISGVNPGTSRARLAEMWPGAAESFECCVDLGHAAQSTEGNAEEVRVWARANNFGTLILVTSEYHMPRALVETHARLAGATIIAYPVASGYIDGEGRPASGEAWRRLAFEYSKYLAARVKTLIRSGS